MNATAKPSRDRTSVSIAACIAALLPGGGALAQTAAAGGEAELTEIVITAEKHPERLADVPVSAAVVSSQSLAATDSSDISDLNKLVPSVNLNGTFNGRVPMGIRGVSSVSNEGTVGLSSGVAILIDGVPVPSDSLAGNELDDAQSVEVLKGPQATLGGRTAASGVINIVTRGPTDTFTGDVSGTATTDHEYKVNGFLAGPIAPGLDFSLSGYDNDTRYPIYNTQLDRWSTQKVVGTRAKLLFKPSDDLDITLTGHYNRMTSDGFNLVYTYITPGTTLLVRTRRATIPDPGRTAAGHHAGLWQQGLQQSARRWFQLRRQGRVSGRQLPARQSDARFGHGDSARTSGLPTGPVCGLILLLERTDRRYGTAVQ